MDGNVWYCCCWVDELLLPVLHTNGNLLLILIAAMTGIREISANGKSSRTKKCMTLAIEYKSTKLFSQTLITICGCRLRCAWTQYYTFSNWSTFNPYLRTGVSNTWPAWCVRAACIIIKITQTIGKLTVYWGINL